ncbi:MAG: FG-GAP-like repeat-containing protein [Desulfosarcinaceae bacterium]|nr:FG-GAP-like repeat-containing protein [Desulfosarcinaceae bacterium]
MKNHCTQLGRTIVIGWLVAIILIVAAASFPANAQESKRIVILPLAINADQDLAFLQRGLQNMLTSRLTVPGRLIPVEHQLVADALAAADLPQGPLPPSRAIDLARRLGADYVMVGSLTVFGETISTDAQVFAVDTGDPRVSFHQVGESQSEVIRHVDAFSADVNQALLGIVPRQPAATALAPAAPTQPAAPPASDPRRHPETLLAPGSASLQATGTRTLRGLSEPWISRAFKTELSAVAVGDVDGDGANEIVIADGNTITLHRLVQGQLTRVSEYEAKSRNLFLNIHVADINDNGKAEIFVTNLPTGSDRLRSFVLEWEETGLKPIVEKQNWFYLVMVDADGEASLYGQKKGEDIDTFGISHLFEDGVYSLAWREGRYEPDLRQPLPKGGNILSLAYGDGIEGSERTVLNYSRNYRLNLFEAGGDEVWTSEEHQGSRNQYIEVTVADDFKKDNARARRVFMPHRILVADLNGNGQREVVVAYNAENLTSLSRTKLFKNGQVQGLEWNGLNLTPVWNTAPVAKFIADVNVGDVDNDGSLDVIYAVVNKTGVSKKKNRSTLVVQRFVAPQ